MASRSGSRSIATTVPESPAASRPKPQALNEVRLLGRWVAAVARELPSGDEVVTARLVVPRVDCGVDTIDCALWRADLRRRALRVPLGSLMEVHGSLRRRFWRSPNGPASRYEVEVTRLRKAGSG